MCGCSVPAVELTTEAPLRRRGQSSFKAPGLECELLPRLGLLAATAHGHPAWCSLILGMRLLADRLGLTRKSRSLMDGKREVNLLIYREQCNSGQTKQILEVTSTGRGVHSKETHIQWEGLTRTARSQLRRASPEQ